MADLEVVPHRPLLILQSVSNSISKQSWPRIEQEMAFLVEISRLFTDIELRVHVLSLYETIATKVRVGRRKGIGFLNSEKNIVLVDQGSAEIGTQREQCLGLHTNHADLCHLGPLGAKPDTRLQKWFEFLFGEESIEAMRGRLKAYQVRTSPVVGFMDLSTLDIRKEVTDPDPSNDDLARANSNDATAGSSDTELLRSWIITPSTAKFPSSRRQVQLPCFGIETLIRDKDFFGRESILRDLDKRLLPSRELSFSSEARPQKHAVLCGMGGVGKTSIALEWAYRNKENFEAVFWIRADEVSKLEQDFGQIAGKLGLEDPSEPRNPIVSRELTKGWLADPKKILDSASDLVGQAEASWLIIFNNADKPDMLRDYWPISSSGSILVTSRDPLAQKSPAIASFCVDIPAFSDNEAAILLRRLSQFDRETDISLTIAHKLGGLPLAISQMAAIIRYQYLSFADFLERYEDEVDRKDLLAFEAGLPRQQARGTLASIWAVENLEPQARTLLEVCSVLDPDCIQERILNNDACSSLSLEHYPDRRFTFFTARALLINGSLIKRNDTLKELRIHRVLQDSTRAKMTQNRMSAVIAAAVTLVSAAWGTTNLVKRHDITLSKDREGLYPHALCLINRFSSSREDYNSDTKIRLAFLSNEAGWWQHERGNSHDVKHLFELTIEICQDCADKNTTELVGDGHYGLSAIANETNDGEACLRHTKVLLDIHLRVFRNTGKSDVRLAVAHNEIGIAWVMNGDYEKGIAAYKESIRVYESLDDFWPGMDTNPRTNMGFTYWVLGDLENASMVLERLLKDREARFGLDDSESHRTGRVLHGLGNVRFDQNQLEKSEALHRKALAHYRRTVGNNHHKTGDLSHKVAQHCMRHGELKEAGELIDKALNIFRLRKDIYTPELARTSFLKAKLLAVAKKVEAADEMFAEAKRLRNSVSWATPRRDDNITEADYDTLVAFFSR